MVDFIAAVVELLKENIIVAELTSERIFGNELPRAEAASMPRKAVVIQPSGGGTFPVGFNDTIRHQALRFDTFCYGETPFEAERLRRATHEAMKYATRQVVSQALIHWINPAGGLLALRDPDTDWPVQFQSWEIFFAEQEIISEV